MFNSLALITKPQVYYE